MPLWRKYLNENNKPTTASGKYQYGFGIIAKTRAKGNPPAPLLTEEFVIAWDSWCDNHNAQETVDLLVEHEMWITTRGDNRANHENKARLYDTVVGYARRKHHVSKHVEQDSSA